VRERAAWGALAGLAGGLLIGLVMAYQSMFTGDWGMLLYVLYAAALGALLGVGASSAGHGPAVAACGGVLLGCLGWLLLSLTLLPLSHGQAPTWSAAAAARTYPELVGYVLHGAVTGILLPLLTPKHSSETRPGSAAKALRRIVIVGGGFAGVSAAKRFERLALRGAPVDVTLVSDSNFLLFTPMLAEAASGAVEARHISAPVRAAVPHTRFRHGKVERIDPEAGTITLVAGDVIGYDHLILAAGSVPHTFGLPGVEQHAWTLKSLADATRLRDHVIGLLERAEQEPDPEQRRRILTFVVAGAGFAGTEMVAELFDLVHGVAQFYPAVGPQDARFVLVHPGDRILPELGPELAGYALDRLRARGIECRLGVRVAEATADEVWLTDGDWISTETFVWTAGNRPSPLVADLSPVDTGRALHTDPAMRAIGFDQVWAIGDCARIPDVDRDGEPYPPTAQHAIRQGKVVADNIVAVLAGRQPADFRFRTIGVLVALGHRTAAGDIRGHRFSGLAAWLLWRGIYLAKLPGIEKRIRVLFDWLLDLVFPRDIVVTTEARTRAGKVDA
jgi:NADH dehydrogenase